MKRTAYVADAIVDRAGRRDSVSSAVLVCAGTIEAICRPADLPLDVRVVDFAGCTLVPGLIDAHVHLNLPGTGTTAEESLHESDDALTETAAVNLRLLLAAGVTTVRDVGSRGSTVLGLRDAVVGPSRLLASGPPITEPRGHCWQFGGEARGESDVRARVRELVDAGVDLIKVMGSGGGTTGTALWRTAFSRGELAAIVEEAHALERRVTVHSLCAEATAIAIDAGVDQIEHASFFVETEGDPVQHFDESVADRLAESGIPVTTTLANGEHARRMVANRRAGDPLRERAESMAAQNVEKTARLHDLGVTLVAGTDAGWRHTPFDAIADEVELLCVAGMSAGAAVAAATSVAARVLGLERDTGTLQPGLAADLVAVEGDPIADAGAIRRIRGVVAAGREIAPASR
jgi:imidazolonepropionase-like amidohydrolase